MSTRCFGVFPGGSDWYVAVMDFDLNQNDLASISDHRGICSTNQDVEFYSWCDTLIPRMGIMPQMPLLDDGSIIQRLRQCVQLNNLAGPYFAAKDDGWGDPDAIGFCHPYRTPPLVRRLLPALFDGNPTNPHETILPDGARLYAIETPLACCLDLVARKDVGLPSNLLVLSGSKANTELTHVDLSLNGDELRLSVLMSSLVNGILDQAAKEDLQEEFKVMHNGSMQLGTFVTLGKHLKQEATQVADAFGLAEDTIRYESEMCAAVGAARCAAWACLPPRERALHGCEPLIRRLHVEHVNPWDLGVICCGEGGCNFWHRLFRRKRRLPITYEPLRITGETPSRILFAERRDSRKVPSAWLREQDWRENDLRWFACTPINLPANDDVVHLEGSIKIPSILLDNSWSDPLLEVRGIA